MKKIGVIFSLSIILALNSHSQDFSISSQVPLLKLDPSLQPIADSAFGVRLGAEISPAKDNPFSLSASLSWLSMPSSVEKLKLQTVMAALGLGFYWYQGPLGQMGPYLQGGVTGSLVDTGDSSGLNVGLQLYSSLAMRYKKNISPDIALGLSLGMGTFIEQTRNFYNPEGSVFIEYHFSPSVALVSQAANQEAQELKELQVVKEVKEARAALDSLGDVKIIGSEAVEGQRIVIYSSFKANATVLTARFYEQLPEILKYLKTVINLKSIEIVGYVADDGSKVDGLKLSLERAKLVHKIFVQKFPEFRGDWIVLGLGGINPLADNKTEVGRSLNRRIELILHVNP